MAAFLHNGPCPKCGSKDNLGNYDDGSKWCWGCHYYVPPQISGFVTQQRKQAARDEEDEDGHSVTLPEGISTEFPDYVVSFIKQYDLTVEELIRHGYFYLGKHGHKFGSLGRVYRGLEDGPAKDKAEQSYETRSFEPFLVERKRHKKFTGSKSTADTYCRAKHSRKAETCVIVEDSLSSLKIARVCDSLALLGTSLHTDKALDLAKKYQQVFVWLDRDKFKEGWEIADKLSFLGLKTQVILTDKDPKYYSEDEIMEKLND